MRELKFRAWDKRKRIMVYRNENGSADYWDGVLSSEIEMINALLNDSSYEFMQYTGLKDRNGREIYEGDVVLCDSDYITENCVICYDVNRAMYKAVPLSMYFSNAGTGSWTGYVLISTYEVLGNIFEHPHLLEANGYEFS